MNGKQDTVSLEWLDTEGQKMLANCFDWTVEELPEGSVRTVKDRVGWVLSGNGVFLNDREQEKPVSAGMFIGVRKDPDSGREKEEGVFRTSSFSRIAWFDYDLLCFACYKGCWFPARVMREVDDTLES